MRKFKPVRIAGIYAGLAMAVAGMLVFSASAFAETGTFKYTGKERNSWSPPASRACTSKRSEPEGGTAEHQCRWGPRATVSGDLAVKSEEVLYVEVGGTPRNAVSPGTPAPELQRRRLDSQGGGEAAVAAARQTCDGLDRCSSRVPETKNRSNRVC